MDNSAVTFVDTYYLDTYYPATNVEIVRTARHSIIKQGIEVPQGMDEFNDWMGGVDTAGNLKSGHYDMEAIGRCSKWTHKMFYGLLGLTVAVCWCIYRVLHPLGDPIYMTREQFGLHLIIFFWSNEYQKRTRSGGVASKQGKPNIPPAHQITQVPKGSRYGSDARRARGRCMQCSNLSTSTLSQTSWYCYSCKLFCHPECMPALHSKLTDKPKKPNPSIEKIENDYENGKFDNFKD